MNIVKPLFVTVLLIGLAINVASQSPRRNAIRRPAAKAAVAQPTPLPEPTAAPAARPARSPIPLATMNGQTITSADIDQNVRQEVESLDDRIAEARRQVIELQINTALLETEAAKRKMPQQQLYDIEVARKVTEPTAAEINKVLQDNRDRFAQSDAATARQQVIDYLKGQREEQLSAEFVKRLRAANPVVNNTPAGTATLPPNTVIATVGTRQITAGTIDERLKPINYKLRLNTYQLTKEAVDRTINDALLLADAGRRGVPPEEIVRKEISEKVHAPTEAEVTKFYNDNKSRINAELPNLKNEIASYLQEQERQRLEQELSNRLRANANVRMLITEPPLPVQSISVDDDPSRGDANAPVTIVEFTDFQCPACAAMQPFLEEALKTYGSKVRLVVRDFPLTMHTNARKAAEAANAANAQGKFFEYTALLFKRQNALDIASLKKYATEIGLDRARFDADLDRGKYAAEVKHDMADGEIYGVDSTPAIFINGVALREMSMEALRSLIDRSLAARSGTPKASTN
jgi:protein-disulfide isomerase